MLVLKDFRSKFQFVNLRRDAAVFYIILEKIQLKHYSLTLVYIFIKVLGN